MQKINNLKKHYNSVLHGCLYSLNLEYLENLYSSYLTESHSINKNWKKIFQTLDTNKVSKDNLISHTKNTSQKVNNKSIQHYKSHKKLLYLVRLINNYRMFGYKHANINPLILKINAKNTYNDHFNLHTTQTTNLEQDLIKDKFYILNDETEQKNLIKTLNNIYCGTIGFEYMHVLSPLEREWLTEEIESKNYKFNFTSKERKNFLKLLIASNTLEKYLSNKFPGTKRFSLEGGEVLIVILIELIKISIFNKMKEVSLGMAHRGRLNVLINVLGQKTKSLFDKFLYKKESNFVGSGDVKYHLGFSSKMSTEYGDINLNLLHNPSHLEIISSVVAGYTRGKIDNFNCKDSNRVLPITIHGDAAITGQGVIQETLNISQTEGYTIGGSIRIIVNNQIGFTTSDIKDMRSTNNCSDVGKIIHAPIFHVNSDDPEAAVYVARLAIAYRKKFKRDVFINVTCYRKNGHNEIDDPKVTQPLMYKIIDNHCESYVIYANKLKKLNIINNYDVTNFINKYKNLLDNGVCITDELYADSFTFVKFKSINNNNLVLRLSDYSKRISVEYLKSLLKKLCTIPSDFVLHPIVDKVYKNRIKMSDEKINLDWGTAETLAYATLLDNGISVRISGEDSKRGTFFHRHAEIHDQIKGTKYIPLCHVCNERSKFQIWNSALSEEAVLAFEYGYSISSKCVLNIWEAQFGDFANGAQVVIDQFISSGEQKWGEKSKLVLLLPHGYEGQGPEHSSARIERYLQLCAQSNMKILIPSTSAQMYHAIVSHATESTIKPLILFSPKSLLRNPKSASSLNDLAYGKFKTVLDDKTSKTKINTKCIIWCSGKIYYELIEEKVKLNSKVPIIRVEQLYPFPKIEICKILKLYNSVDKFIWCQEEPLNQGAWLYIKEKFNTVSDRKISISCVGRIASAATATGYLNEHKAEQKNIITNVFKFC